MTSTSPEALKVTTGCTPHFSESFGECIFNLDDACLSLAPFQMKITHRMLNHYLLEFADYMGFELRRWDTWRLPTPKTRSWTTST